MPDFLVLNSEFIRFIVLFTIYRFSIYVLFNYLVISIQMESPSLGGVRGGFNKLPQRLARIACLHECLADEEASVAGGAQLHHCLRI